MVFSQNFVMCKQIHQVYKMNLLNFELFTPFFPLQNIIEMGVWQDKTGKFPCLVFDLREQFCS